MPNFEAPPIPPKYDSGTEMTRAHGHDTTRNVSARYIQPSLLSLPSQPEKSDQPDIAA